MSYYRCGVCGISTTDLHGCGRSGCGLLTSRWHVLPNEEGAAEDRAYRESDKAARRTALVFWAIVAAVVALFALLPKGKKNELANEEPSVSMTPVSPAPRSTESSAPDCSSIFAEAERNFGPGWETTIQGSERDSCGHLLDQLGSGKTPAQPTNETYCLNVASLARTRASGAYNWTDYMTPEDRSRCGY